MSGEPKRKMFKLDELITASRQFVPPKTVDGPPIARGVWEAAVGTRIARRAEPARLDKGVLVVRVANAAWANELALLSADIITQLEAGGVKVSGLRFKVGPLTHPQPKREAPKTGAPKNAKLPAYLAPAVERIEDDDLRSALAEAAAKTLSLLKP